MQRTRFELSEIEIISLLLLPSPCLLFKIAFLAFQELGLKITAEKAKTLQARGYLKKNLFSAWSLLTESLQVAVSVQSFIQCLTVFEGSTHLEMSIEEEGQPILLILEGNNIVTKCQVATLNTPFLPMVVSFTGKPVVNRLQMKASFLKDCLSDFDVPSAAVISVSFSAFAFKLQVSGSNVAVEVSFPNDINADASIFLEFECGIPSTHSYSLALFKQSMKLGNVKNVSIRAREDGFLSITHMLQIDEAVSYVEFVLSPMVEVENPNLD